MQRRRNAAETLIDTVNRQKLGADWQENAKANEPGQLAQRPVGEGIIIGKSLNPSGPGAHAPLQ